MFPPSTSPPAVKIIALSSFVLSLSVIVTVVATVAVEAVPVTSPVTLPSMLATSVPVVMLRLPVLLALSVVVPRANLSADSSHINRASLPVEPLCIIIPTSLELEPAPLFSSSKLSDTVVFVVFTVVVVPLTVRLPVIVRLSLTVVSDVL